MFLSLLPKVPLITRVALLHMLNASPSSKYLDLKTSLTVAVIRSFLTPSKPLSITATQKLLNRDPGIKGRIWVSKYTAPASPGTGVRDAMVRAIEGLQSPGMNIKEDFNFPDAAPVEAEWTGYRAEATEESTLPLISEQEKYAELMNECKSPTTVLFFHGGAYYLMDPATHRPITKLLAKLTGGRCYSVRYRLAPQNVFPAAVMDALASYLTLLYPPPGAFHEPVKPEHIVFAGDSAGGNLSLALLQTLLELHRQSVTISWFGAEREVPLPAGIAVNSPWTDLTHSSPSCKANAPFDYLPVLAGPNIPPRPACAAWPASPPRASLYVDDNLLTHPLVTLLLAQSWHRSPPVYICTGWELLADEDKLTATMLHRDGVKVVFEEYEAMPHCFALIFRDLPGSRRCVNAWAGFMKRVVEEGPEAIEQSSFTSVKAKTLEEVKLELADLTPYEEDIMREKIYRRIGVNMAPLDGPAKL